jgi:hypothetical protein
LKDTATVFTEKIPVDALDTTGTITADLSLDPASLKVAPGSKDKVEITYFAKERSE